MKNLNWQSEELEWIERVRELLIELARASLADIPRLPTNLSEKAFPLVKEAQEILDAASRQGISEEARLQYPELQWVEQVRKFFLDLLTISLSEHPQLPEHLSRNALELAQKAEDIQEEAEAMNSFAGSVPSMETEDTTPQAPVSESLDANSSPGVLLEALKKSVKMQWADSSRSDAPEWSQLVNLLDLAQDLYQRVKE